MILWINGAFGAGKTTAAFELCRRLPDGFIYDPENVGYFLRKNLPARWYTPDFQDLPLWRELNFRLLKTLGSQYPGVVIVPMTLVREDYQREIIGALAAEGIPVTQVVLQASRETLLRRLKKRSLGRLSREKFGVEAIGRCLDFFDRQTGAVTVPTDGKTVEQVVEQLAEAAGLTLLPDARGRLGRALFRLKIVLSHIRN